MELRYKKLSFEDVYSLCLKLSEGILRYYGKDYEKITLIAISRGGLVPARLIADLTSKKDIWTISAKSYIDIDKREQVSITQDVKTNLENRRILLIDDIADSGNTIKTIKELFELRGAKEVKSCTLHYKRKSVIEPDFYAEEVDNNVWIIYPWEIHEFNNKK
ncbi:MAG: phosphoribosyltransferase family protein [Candidatus Anstonellales archaeon]